VKVGMHNSICICCVQILDAVLDADALIAIDLCEDGIIKRCCTYLHTVVVHLKKYVCVMCSMMPTQTPRRQLET